VVNSPVSEVEEKGLRTLKEFREFAMKGNVVDLAVGVIIAAAKTEPSGRAADRDLLKES